MVDEMNYDARILLVDDDEEDYLITRGLLSEVDGHRFQLDWASTYELARSAIGRNEYDVFLVDYRLGEKSGLDLLREAITSGCRAPIILLTGQGDRDVDVEAMRSGAADYLAKGQITPSLLERSIRHALERNEAVEALRRSEERFRLLIENAYDLLTIVEADGTVRYESPSVSRILGYAQEEIIGRNLFDYVHPDDLSRSREAFKEMCATAGFGRPVEFRLRHSDGSWHFLESVGNNLLTDPGVGGVV